MDLEMNLCISARKQKAAAVVHVDFDKQGASVRVHCIGRADQLALEAAVRQIGKREVRPDTRPRRMRINLRHVGEDAEPVYGGDMKELPRRAT